MKENIDDKKDKPTHVLVTLDKYEEIEDYRLFLEAEKRLEEAGENDFINHEKMLKCLNIHKDDSD